MVVIKRDPNGRAVVFCDPCLEPLVRALNQGGIPTVASCCGHGGLMGNIALKDGRELIIAANWDQARGVENMIGASVCDGKPRKGS